MVCASYFVLTAYQRRSLETVSKLVITIDCEFDGIADLAYSTAYEGTRVNQPSISPSVQLIMGGQTILLWVAIKLPTMDCNSVNLS